MVKKVLLLSAMLLSLAVAAGVASPDLPTPDCYPCTTVQ